MQAATAPAFEIQGALQHIPTHQLHPSKYNPRKHFDKGGLEELAESIRAQGIVVPLTVRAAAEGFEIVAGERRFRAARLAGLATVPAIVRELTDEAARELQIIENLQRQDITPLEEAEAFQQLHEIGKTDVKEIAGRVGKSIEFVYGRMKLLALAAPVRKELAEGKISAGHAIEIARLPETVQRTVAQDVRHGDMSVAELRGHIRENFNLDLESAPWKAQLAAPELDPKAGPCTTCPKRAGNMPGLAGLKASTCTDVNCFRTKAKAFIKSEMLKNHALAPVIGDGYMDNPPAGALREWSDYRKVEGAKTCKVAEKGIIVAARRPEQLGKVIPICRDRKCKTHWRNENTMRVVSAASKRDAEKRKREKQLCNALLAATVIAARKAKSIDPADLRIAAFAESDHLYEGAEVIASAFGVKPEQINEKWIAKLSGPELAALMLGCSLAEPYAFKREQTIRTAAKRHGVDVKAIEKSVAAAAAKPKKQTSAKSAKAKPAAKAKSAGKAKVKRAA